jgi:FkbM family methyltransferase
MDHRFYTLIRNERPTALQQLLSDAFPVVIYGTGYCARSLADSLLQHGKKVAYCTVERRWIGGVSQCGSIPIIALDELHHHIPACNLAVAMGTARPNWDLLASVPGVHMVIGNIGFARGLPMTRAFVTDHCRQIEDCYGAFADDLSRTAFCDYLESRLYGHTDNLPTQYSPNGWFTSVPLGLTEHEVYCDCGAYDGDTLALFVDATRKFQRVYAWEPDPTNVNRLRNFIAERGLDNVTVVESCTGSAEGELYFDALGTSVSAPNQSGAYKVAVETIDHTCPETSLVKIDIEGAEIEALRGAEQTIRRQKPRIIVAAYHRREDLFCLQLLLRSFRPDYRFYFRWHRCVPDDVMLYAV